MNSETIVVVGGNVWAKGNDLAAAKKAFSNRGGKLGDGYGIYTFDSGTEFKGIDNIGRYHYVGNAPTLIEVAAKSKSARR